MNKQIIIRIMAAWLLVATLGAAVTTSYAQGGKACPGFLPSRLEIGEMGRPLPGLNPEIFLADEPAATASATELLPDDAVFTVLNGPECLEGSAWWQIDYDGSTGWIMEGMDEEYWLTPVPVLDQTYDDGALTFDYPGGWEVLLDEAGTVLLGEPGTSGVESGAFLMAVYKDAHLIPSLSDAQGTPTELLVLDAAAGAEQGVHYGDPITVEIDGREIAYTYTTSDDLGMDSMVFVIDLGNGEAAYLASVTALGEVTLSQPVAVAMAYSLMVPGQGTPIEGSELSSVLGGGDSDTVVLEGAYSSDDGRFYFQHPADWIAETLDDGAVALINNESVLAVTDLDSFGPDQLFVIIYPTLAHTGDYPVDTVDSNTVASTVVSYYASMGMAAGYMQEGAMETLSVGDREVSYSFAHASTHDRLVLAVDDGMGDFTVMIAIAAPGELEPFIDILVQIAGTVNAG